jgi:DNA-binding response OmpR family regulator
LVDDETQLLERLATALRLADYTVETAGNGHEGLQKFHAFQPDVAILDINMEERRSSGQKPMDGIELLQRIRAESSDICVLMLTSTALSYVKIAALNMGADDYLTKPFDTNELLARVDAVLRRARGKDAKNKVLNFKRLRIDIAAQRVWKDDTVVELTPIEFEILHTLARRPGQVFARGQLISQAWDHSYAGDERLVDVHIGRLRKKIEDEPANPTLIHTVWGKGYRFEEV